MATFNARFVRTFLIRFNRLYRSPLVYMGHGRTFIFLEVHGTSKINTFLYAPLSSHLCHPGPPSLSRFTDYVISGQLSRNLRSDPGFWLNLRRVVFSIEVGISRLTSCGNGPRYTSTLCARVLFWADGTEITSHSLWGGIAVVMCQGVSLYSHFAVTIITSPSKVRCI